MLCRYEYCFHGVRVKQFTVGVGLMIRTWAHSAAPRRCRSTCHTVLFQRSENPIINKMGLMVELCIRDMAKMACTAFGPCVGAKCYHLSYHTPRYGGRHPGSF